MPVQSMTAFSTMQVESVKRIMMSQELTLAFTVGSALAAISSFAMSTEPEAQAI